MNISDDSILISGSGDNTIKLWSMTSKELLHTVADFSSRIQSIVLTSDDKFFLMNEGGK